MEKLLFDAFFLRGEEKPTQLNKALIWKYAYVCFRKKLEILVRKKILHFQSAFEALIEPVKLSDSGFGMFLTFPF